MLFERKNKIVYSLHKNTKISLAICSMVKNMGLVYHKYCQKDDLSFSKYIIHIIIVFNLELGGINNGKFIIKKHL